MNPGWALGEECSPGKFAIDRKGEHNMEYEGNDVKI